MRWLWIVMGCLFSLQVAAMSVEGVDLPEKMEVAGQPLVLNGAGIREKFFFDIYVAALYLPQKMSDAQKILQDNPAWRLSMNFLYSEVSKEKLDKGWDEGFENNLTASRMKDLKERLENFKAMFTSMHKGDEVVLTHVPGTGVVVSVKGERKGVVPGADFASALLSVWLGEDPVTGSLKKALLGRH